MHTTHQDGIITVLIDDRPPIGRGGAESVSFDDIVQPWDYDREYRAERVSRAVATLAAALEAERRHLRGRYSDAELTALWPDIVAGLTARLASGLPRHAATLARQGE